jgi:hypothetical protein
MTDLGVLMLIAEVPRGVPVGCYVCKLRKQRTETDPFNYHCTAHDMTVSMWTVCSDYQFYGDNPLPYVQKVIQSLEEGLVYLYVMVPRENGIPPAEHRIPLVSIEEYQTWDDVQRTAAFEQAEAEVLAMFQPA